MRPASELELFGPILHSTTCLERQVGASLGDRFGVVITWEGAEVDVWGWIDGALRFRTLANWEPHTTAVNAHKS